MTNVVFVGPTLSGDPILASADFDWQPPAAEGDVYRAARRKGVRAIGLIDGQFESVPSVWHKEILWALSRGIRVFGAASMGALRAAELADFGMTGVGAIFRRYRDGTLRDDDEVAVLHAPAELGYRPLTDSMVDIRATLEQARSRGVVSARAAAILSQSAKALFFKERTWTAILEEAGIPNAQRARFARWLPANKVDLKRADALAMLRRMSKAGRDERRRPAPGFRFQRTDFWLELERRHDGARRR